MSVISKSRMMQFVLALLLIVMLSLSVLGFGATRVISGNQVTLTIDPTGGTGVATVQEKFTGSVSVTQKPASCGYAGTTLTCDYDSTATGSIVYTTSGTGSVSGVIVSGSLSPGVTGDSTIPKTATEQCPTGATGTPPTCACPSGQIYSATLNTCKSPSPPCTSNWQCADWSTCASGTQTHTCTDLNKCTAGSTKTESQVCTTSLKSVGEACPSYQVCETQKCLAGKCAPSDWQCSVNADCYPADLTCNKATHQCGKCPTGASGQYPSCFCTNVGVEIYDSVSNACKPVASTTVILTCVDSDVIATNDAGFASDYKYVNLNQMGIVKQMNNQGLIMGQALADACDQVTGKLIERFCNNNIVASEEIACPVGATCQDGACVSVAPACVDSDAVAGSNGHDALAYASAGSVKDENAIVHLDSCTADGRLTEQLCSGGSWEPETITCNSEVPGSTCVNNACVIVAGVSVTAADQQEASLFQRIHDALKKNEGNVLKEVSSVAGVFQCYFKSGCDLATYSVK